MNAAEWGKSLIGAGILLIITAALIYWIWPDWMAARSVTGRPGFLLVMGGGGLITSLLGAYMRAK